MHHPVPSSEPASYREDPPVPSDGAPAWIESFARAFGEDQETRWSRRMLRHASDMMVVCDDDLTILYHNRSFLRAVGHQSGTFRGQSLFRFFPREDQGDAEQAFHQLLTGRSGGMRISATFLTLSGRKKFEARVTRSRCGESSYHLYFVVREESATPPRENHAAGETHDPLLVGLPVAAFRTDRKLRIVHTSGNLWHEGFRCDPALLIGADLSDPSCPRTPGFLRRIDYCDTMAALSLHAEFDWGDVGYEVVVEPFLDEKKKRVLGAVGLIRVAKRAAKPQERTKKIEIFDRSKVIPERTEETSQGEQISRIRDSIQPRSISSPDRDREKADKVALLN